ncbi:MAG: zf-HC2 domain-containing protein [Planctomycetota bacterium]|nr:zf-HC2 domain-containing protein [Planctomycetota bacterium]
MKPHSSEGSANKDWQGRLSAWFDGECSDLDAAEVRAHLMGSPESRAQFQEWRSLREDLALLQPKEASQDRLERMRLRFEDGMANEVFQVSRALRSWNVAAALLLTLGMGMWLSDRFLSSGPQDTYASQASDLDAAIEDPPNIHGDASTATH